MIKISNIINIKLSVFQMSAHKIISRNPFTKAINKEFSVASREDIDKAIQRGIKGYELQLKRTP